VTVTRVVTVWCDTDQCEASAVDGGDRWPTGWRRMGARDFCPECCGLGQVSFTADQTGMLSQCRERPKWVRARMGDQMRTLKELFEFGLLERREYTTKTGAPRFEYKAKP
jgi:hypothetical protein